MKHRLSERWIKAAIAGTIWAASEIVLGSFLHNLRVPFSGNILTAIGIIILISISYLWTDKGLFWRAGIICALMKTMSPSAIIFGPMIAIFAESVLMDLSVRFLGRTYAGYLVGAMLAMSWNLFQKIANYIIFYGANIIEVYNNILVFAQKQLNTTTNLVWLPVIILLVLFALFGLLAGIAGIIAGRRMLQLPASEYGNNNLRSYNRTPPKTGNGFNYSLTWLFANIGLIIGSFFLLSKTSWYIWSSTITAIIIVWSLRYTAALRQVSKPRFWVLFIFITLIAAFAFAVIQGNGISLSQGILTGVQMNFRAAIMVTGFSVLGTELYNPLVRDFFKKTAARNLPMALELAVESLPAFITNMPDVKSIFKNPVSIFHRVISQADIRLYEIKEKNNSGGIFIITGKAAAGKTTYVRNLIGFLRKNNIKTYGIISEKVITGTVTTGYDLVNIQTGEKRAFLRLDEECGTNKIGKYTICEEGFTMGTKILGSVNNKGLVIIDEVGLLEVDGGGWAESINKLTNSAGNNVLLVVRDVFADAVINKFDMAEAVIFRIKQISFREAGKQILSMIN